MTTTDEQMLAALHAAVEAGEFHIFDPQTVNVTEPADDDH